MKRKYKILIIIGIIILIMGGYIIYLYSIPTISILGYHNIYNSKEEKIKNNEFVIDVDKFDEQMRYLKTHNYKTLSLDEFNCWKNKKCDFGKKTVMITFDDGYYYNYKYAFEILKKYNLNAVVFFIGTMATSSNNNINDDINSYMSLDTIKKSEKEYPNIEFASHSYNMHGKRNVGNMTKEEIKEDIEEFAKIYDTEYIAYPGGNYNNDYINLLKEKKYKNAFGFGPKHRKAKQSDNDYDVPRLNISSDMSIEKFKFRINMPI